MKIPCEQCGAAILPETAERTLGLCMPCSKQSLPTVENCLNIHFLDSSALIKYFFDEEGSERIRAYVDRCSSSRLFNTYVFRMTALCLGETLGRFKAKRDWKEISADEYQRYCERILDFEASISTVEPARFSFFPLFREQLRRVMSDHRLDVSDAHQIATIKWVRDELGPHYVHGERYVLVTADRRLAHAARAEGLRAWDILSEDAP